MLSVNPDIPLLWTNHLYSRFGLVSTHPGLEKRELLLTCGLNKDLNLFMRQYSYGNGHYRFLLMPLYFYLEGWMDGIYSFPDVLEGEQGRSRLFEKQGRRKAKSENRVD